MLRLIEEKRSKTERVDLGFVIWHPPQNLSDIQTGSTRIFPSSSKEIHLGIKDNHEH